MITLDTLRLPDALLWTDEFSAVPVAASEARTLSGRLVVTATPLTAGRPVTLGSEADAWITRADLLTLHAWAGTAGWTGTLALHDGRTFLVRFRTGGDNGPLATTPVRDVADPGDDAPYMLTACNLETV